MNISINWENLTDKELEQIKESLKSETQKRKEKEKAIVVAINNFLNAFHELRVMGVAISICEGREIPLYEEDFYFESEDGSKNYSNY